MNLVSCTCKTFLMHGSAGEGGFKSAMCHLSLAAYVLRKHSCTMSLCKRLISQKYTEPMDIPVIALWESALPPPFQYTFFSPFGILISRCAPESSCDTLHCPLNICSSPMPSPSIIKRYACSAEYAVIRWMLSCECIKWRAKRIVPAVVLPLLGVPSNQSNVWSYGNMIVAACLSPHSTTVSTPFKVKQGLQQIIRCSRTRLNVFGQVTVCPCQIS